MDRIFVRFKSPEQKIDALSGGMLRAINTLSGKMLPASAPANPDFSRTQPDVMHVPATDEMRRELEKSGAEIFEDVQFRVFPGNDIETFDSWSYQNDIGEFAENYTLHDVVEQVRAPEAWERTQGEGATIVVVDTGIADTLQEFSPTRRVALDFDSHYRGSHWVDTEGHGSMCAAVAAASKKDGGRYDGVAPAAKVVSARSTLKSTDLFDIFDELVQARRLGTISGPLIVSNSYGLYTCKAPNVMPQDHPYMSVILAAIQSGIFVCFAAGNNHLDVCGHDPRSGGPNTIWGPNSHDDVMSVGTVNRELTNCDPASPHVNSSRGPGEWAKLSPKPDCVAPTYGEVVWGTSLRRMGWWGTSGACPQVAGLAALILSVFPTASPAVVAGIIRESCSTLPESTTCVGRGLIDCAEAVEAAAARSVTS
jgi:subtilisin family serine protease